MNDDSGFKGFPRECVAFWSELAGHNDKLWFEAHRRDYDDYVMAPGRDFVLAAGQALSVIAPGVQADPRVNKSIFRLNRDTRFSHDKSPYKTHMGLWFWEGSRPRMECSGFYFHLEPPRLMLGAGIYCFSRDALEEYRRSAGDAKLGAALKKAVAKVEALGYITGGQHFKRVPRGFDPKHQNAELLMHNGLWVGVEADVPEEFHSPALVDYCLERWADMLPVHRWLLDLTRRI